MFNLDFVIPCKCCGFDFEPSSYPPSGEKSKYCHDCKEPKDNNDIMKGWED